MAQKKEELRGVKTHPDDYYLLKNFVPKTMVQAVPSLVPAVKIQTFKYIKKYKKMPQTEPLVCLLQPPVEESL